MTAIAPNTTVYLVNTRLNYGSEDTFYFDSLSAQTSYFEARRLWGMTNYTYQREQRQYIKVGVNGSQMATVIKSANYLMWKNTSYEDKYYYAFITEAEWINNEVVKLYFEMDYIQTYLFNHGHTQCYIARQHSETDIIGENILPEPMEVGEYVVNGGNTKCLPANAQDADACCFVVMEVNKSQTDPLLVDGVFSAVKLHIFSATQNGADAAQVFINTHEADPEAILGIYATRYYLLGLTAPAPEGNILSISTQPGKRFVEVDGVDENSTIDGYVPKNKKLLTYPYTYCNITNCKGNDVNLRYEFWQKDVVNHYLVMHFTRSMPVTIQIRPLNYKGELQSNSDSEGTSTDAIVELSGQPLGSFAADNYTVWQAQNQANIVGSYAKSILHSGMSLIEGWTNANPLQATGAIFPVLDTVVDNGVNRYNASIAVDRFSGTLSGSAVQYNTEVDGIYYRRMSVNRQYAKVIDDFFTMYGYTQNKVGFPNIHARSRYTYVRTIGFNCTANIPQEARKYINARYDAGIRFWVDHENTFCNYTNANTPLSSTIQTVEERTDNDSET